MPKSDWPYLKDGALWIEPGKANLSDQTNAHFLARRQQHLKFEASTELRQSVHAGMSAGLAAYQNENYWYYLGARHSAQGLQIFLERHAGADVKSYASELKVRPRSLKLRISGDGPRYSFYYDAGDGWQALRENDDGSILSTEVAGGFVGTVLGPFARQE